VRQTILSIVICIGISTAANAQDNPFIQKDLALQVAEHMAPRQQMRNMMLSAIAPTTTFAIIKKKLGPLKSASLLSTEVNSAVDRYGDEWAGLLATSYREVLSVDELNQAESAFQNRDMGKMMPLTNRVAPVMQRKATPLLKRAASEALTAAYEKMMKEAVQ
jgi:hypothetical protein